MEGGGAEGGGGGKQWRTVEGNGGRNFWRAVEGDGQRLYNLESQWSSGVRLLADDALFNLSFSAL